MSAKISKLRDQASTHVGKARWAKALDVYLQLEKLEPKNGDWARRAADMYRRLDRDDDAVGALERAASAYAAAGFLVKAVAVCKMILQDHPEHAGALSQLAELQNARGIPAPKRPAPPPIPAAALAENTPLESLQLGAIIPQATESSAGILVIPLDDDDVIEVDELELLPDESEADLAARQEAADRLARTPLFSGLGPTAMQILVSQMDFIELDAGAALFHQGDRGNTLYVVVDGEVAVISEGPPRVQLSRLGEGEIFGEIALVTEQPRSATIEAVVDTSLLAIDRDVIREVMQSEPGVLVVLLRFLRDRLLENLVNTSPLFQPFQGAERRALAGKFSFLEAERGSVLIEQGSRARGMFVLLSGHAEVLATNVKGADGAAQRRLATLGSGDIFGEMSLLGNTEAIATVRTTSKCFLLEMGADEFRNTIMTHPQVLMVVGELADQRQKQYDAIVAGEADYDEGHLDLF